jgi:hypothetical protein
LDVPGLLHVACVTLTLRVIDKKPAEICKMLGVNPSEYTPEVAEQQRLENPWVEEWNNFNTTSNSGINQ